MLSDLILVVAVLAACVWVARGTRWAPAIECALPLLAVALLVRANFLVLGVIVAVAFAGAALVARETWILVIAGVALLRWIPLRDVEVFREAIVLAGALALYGVRASRPHSPGVSPGDDRDDRGRAGRPPGAGETPALHLIAVLAVAAVTPVHPGKAALFPLLLAGLCVGAGFSRRAFDGRLKPAATHAVLAAAFALAACFARWSLVPILLTAAFALLVPFLGKLRPLAYAAALSLFMMWPWSGVIARALPVVTRFEPPIGELRNVGYSLPPGAARTLDGLKPVLHLVVIASVASAEGLPPGRVVGFIDAGDCTRVVRIGDIADFGFTRRPHFFAARNPLPRITRADIRGYGATAWLHGAGAIGVACHAPITALRFRAAADLPPAARLQIESIELPAR